MSFETTPRLTLPLIQGGQAQKHLTLNAGLMRLESLVQAQALSRTTVAQPAMPSDGDSYILPVSPTGADWSAMSAGAFVRFDSGMWEAIVFPAGSVVHIEDEGCFVVRGSTTWVAFEDAIKALGNLSGLGVNAVADSLNVLAVKGPAVLLSGQYAADGGTGDISLTVNKEADGDTAQILLQKNYSTRAVLGLLGDNDVTLKVSTGGATFTTALIIKPSGAVHTSAGAIIDAGGRQVLRTYTVAGLPASGVSAGTLAFASDARMFDGTGTLEGAGAGTGGLVCWTGAAWTVAGTNQSVSA